jgi:hypothetical protein
MRSRDRAAFNESAGSVLHGFFMTGFPPSGTLTAKYWPRMRRVELPKTVSTNG